MTIKKKILPFALALVLLTLPALWIYSRESVAIGGQQLICWDGQSYRAGGDSLTITLRENGADFDLTLYGEHVAATLEQVGDRITVTFDTGEVVTGYDKGLPFLMNEDGSFLEADALIILVNGQLTEPLGKTDMANRFFAIWKYGGEALGPLWFPLLMAIVYIVGMVQILWPEETYFFCSRWRYNYAELSDDGLFVQKAGGWIAVIGSMALLYGVLLIR